MSGWLLASYILLWVLVVATLVVLLVVLRQLGLIYLRGRTGGPLRLDEGPPVGLPLRFHELDIHGEAIHQPSHDHPLNLVLFTSPWCAICKDTLRGLSALLDHYELKAVVIDAGDHSESRRLHTLVDESVGFVSSLALQRRIGVTTIPFGIVTNEKGVILGKAVVNHLDDLEDLIAEAESHLESVSA